MQRIMYPVTVTYHGICSSVARQAELHQQACTS